MPLAGFGRARTYIACPLGHSPRQQEWLREHDRGLHAVVGEARRQLHADVASADDDRLSPISVNVTSTALGDAP